MSTALYWKPVPPDPPREGGWGLPTKAAIIDTFAWGGYQHFGGDDTITLGPEDIVRLRGIQHAHRPKLWDMSSEPPHQLASDDDREVREACQELIEAIEMHGHIELFVRG